MTRTFLSSAFALAAAIVATPSFASYSAFSDVQNNSTYVRESDISANRLSHSQYTGVGALFISNTSTAVTQFGSFCTGSLISANVVLTAAHCLGTEDGALTGINFYLPEYRATPDLRVFAAADYLVHPDFTGDTLQGNDIALIRLATTPDSQFDRYQIYGDTSGIEELDDFATRVGLGTTGNGETGTSHGIDGYKRYGYNTYDMTWDDVLDAYNTLFPDDGIYGHDGSGYDVFGAPVDSMLAYDFDDGSVQHDVFGRYAGDSGSPNTLGVIDPGKNLPGDSSASPGDSGGPTFVDGKIAGITSFGITGNLLEPADVRCGDPGSVDTSYVPGANGARTCTNSSFGEIGVDTRAASFIGFINDGIDGKSTFSSFVPEPATWAMMISGFGLIGGSMRRRSEVAKVLTA